MYEKHELKVLNFERIDVFADLSIASDADKEGGGSSYHSLQPDRSDSQKENVMYTEHEMRIMNFDDSDAFVGCILVLSGDENGDGAGPGSVNPGLSDS